MSASAHSCANANELRDAVLRFICGEKALHMPASITSFNCVMRRAHWRDCNTVSSLHVFRAEAVRDIVAEMDAMGLTEAMQLGDQTVHEDVFIVSLDRCAIRSLLDFKHPLVPTQQEETTLVPADVEQTIAAVEDRQQENQQQLKDYGHMEGQHQSVDVLPWRGALA